MNDFMPDLYTFLERHFGLSITFHDLDGEEMSIDLSLVSEQAIIGLLATEYKPAVLRRLRLEQMKRMQIFVGGPFAGQSHARSRYSSPVCVMNLGLRRWAAYSFATDDDRLWYQGEATSEKKARLLAWKAVPARNRC